MRKTLRTSLIVAVTLLIVVPMARILAPTSTPPFRSGDGQRVGDSIALNERWRLNGVDQSVVIRGRKLGSPILVWVSDLWCETPALRHFNSDLEDEFVVVYWCQRYSGQSFSPFDSRPSALSVDDYVGDLHVLVMRITEQLHAEKVAIVGHSSGTIVGLRYALVHPEHIAAYIGVGQVVDQAENLRLSYEFALREARESSNNEALAELRKVGAPPYLHDEGAVLRKWVIAFGGAFHNDLSYSKIALIAMHAQEANWRDLAAFVWAESYTDSVAREMAATRFDAASLRFDVPIYLLSGKYDHRTDAVLAQQFVDKIQAPKKLFVLFDSSAHSPNFEEPKKFNEWMIANAQTF